MKTLIRAAENKQRGRMRPAGRQFDMPVLISCFQVTLTDIVKFETFDRDQVSISRTFYIQLLRSQIKKEWKYSQVVSLFFALLGSAHAKAGHRMLVKSTPAIHFWKVWNQISRK